MKKKIRAYKARNYDKFICEIQKAKIKELWDNKADSYWEKF